MRRRRFASNRAKEPLYWSRAVTSVDSTSLGSLVSVVLFDPTNTSPTFKVAPGVDTEVTVRAMRVNVMLSALLSANPATRFQLSMFAGIYCGPILMPGTATLPNPSFATASDQSVDWLWLGSRLSDTAVNGQGLLDYNPNTFEIYLKGLRRLKSGDVISWVQTCGSNFSGGSDATLQHFAPALTVSTLWQRSLRK